MKQEDKQFLAELAKELNTQDNAATANPIWCIMDEEIVAVPDGNGDFLVVAGPEKAIPLEDFADEIAEQVPDALKQEAEVASHLDIDQHRWHSCATDVYKCEDGYVGIFAGFQLFSEQMDWSDACPDTCVSEYEAIQTVTYRPKKCHS